MTVLPSCEGIPRPQTDRGTGERGSYCIGHVEDVTKDQNKDESSQQWSRESLCDGPSIIVG